jgi:hypothetical protein
VGIRLTGHASIHEELYVFAPFTSCARSAQAEYHVDTSDFAKPVGPGSFNVPVQLTISQPHDVNVCAYLQTGPPTAQHVPTGSTVVVGKAHISVS